MIELKEELQFTKGIGRLGREADAKNSSYQIIYWGMKMARAVPLRQLGEPYDKTWVANSISRPCQNELQIWCL